jgi:hypothetical protein
MTDALSIWTVYDHPTDFPTEYVARRSDVRGSRIDVTDHIISSTNLAIVRIALEARGLTKLMRDPNDDPKIIEVWL